MRASVAACASTSGGSRTENFSVVQGRSTLPPSRGLGSPSAPVTSRAAPQVRATSRSTGSGVSRCRPSTIGAALSGNSAATDTRLARCASGIPAPRSSGRRMRPVASSSIPERMRRRIRNDDGTTPPATPLWMPSVSTSTRTVATRLPRNDVVNQRRSKLSPPESRQMTRRGRPMRVPEVLEVGRQVGAPALLARLDEDEDAAVPAARRQQTRHGGERRVAVVRRPAAVEEVAFAHRLVGPEPAAPFAQRRLLVHVSVDDDRIARRRRCRSAGPGCDPAAE